MTEERRNQGLMSRRCRTCGKPRSAALVVCPEDGTPLGDVDLGSEAERSISIDITTRLPTGPSGPAGVVEAAVPRGTRVGDYVIEDQIGAGGGGAVYRASHVEIGKRAAIKVIHFNLASSPSAVQRFLDEARTVNAINHPALVDIFAVGKLPDGRPYLVMELLQGRPLSVALREGKLSMPEKLRIVEQACVALEAAHAKNVVHRDFKPDNIFLLTEGSDLRLKLLDFGVAKLLDLGSQGAREQTRTGMVLGTPVYMSPEQILGDQVGPASDVYSLGVVLYRLFTGRPPFVADTTVELFMQHVQKAAPLPDELSPLVPLRLSRLMHQMLAKNPANRPSLTLVRAAALATLYPNSKLAQQLKAPRRGEDPGRGVVAVESPRATSSIRWFGIGLGLVFSLVMWFFIVGRMERQATAPSPPPEPVRLEGPIVIRGEQLVPDEPVVAPRAPTMSLTDARVVVKVYPPDSEVRVDQTRLAISEGEGVVYLSPAVVHQLQVRAPGFIEHREELRFDAHDKKQLVVVLDPQPSAPQPLRSPRARPQKQPGQPPPVAPKTGEIIDPF